MAGPGNLTLRQPWGGSGQPHCSMAASCYAVSRSARRLGPGVSHQRPGCTTAHARSPAARPVVNPHDLSTYTSHTRTCVLSAGGRSRACGRPPRPPSSVRPPARGLGRARACGRRPRGPAHVAVDELAEGRHPVAEHQAHGGRKAAAEQRERRRDRAPAGHEAARPHPRAVSRGAGGAGRPAAAASSMQHAPHALVRV
jgi:hypothetical protein